MTQYFFADESGDSGKKNQGSSNNLIIGMLQLANREPLGELTELRNKLDLPASFEFHFSKLHKTQKTAFFSAIQSVHYRARVAILDKNFIPIELENLSGMDLEIEIYKRIVLKASPLDMANDVLVLDGKTENFRKKLRVCLSTAARNAQRERAFKKIVSAESQKEDGIQMVDMIVGAIRLNYTNKDNSFYKSIKKKLVDELIIK